jgi:hypothetical protein
MHVRPDRDPHDPQDCFRAPKPPPPDSAKHCAAEEETDANGLGSDLTRWTQGRMCASLISPPARQLRFQIAPAMVLIRPCVYTTWNSCRDPILQGGESVRTAVLALAASSSSEKKRTLAPRTGFEPEVRLRDGTRLATVGAVDLSCRRQIVAAATWDAVRQCGTRWWCLTLAVQRGESLAPNATGFHESVRETTHV